MQTIPVKIYQQSKGDIAKVRTVANNPDLAEDKVFYFGPFMICASGRNYNATDLTAEAQKAAVQDWIGKPIYYGEVDHEERAASQVARIYDSWIEERNGRTETWGMGYGIWTDSNKDLFNEIDGRIKREMSCGIIPTKVLCSVCNSEVDKPTFFGCCPNGHVAGKDGCYFREVEFTPVHLAFVGSPAIEGAGLQAAADARIAALRTYMRTGKGDLPADLAQPLQDLRRQAADGQEFRTWAEGEFKRWFKANNPTEPRGDLDDLVSRLTAKEMVRLARIERDRFHELVPLDGTQRTLVEVEDGMNAEDQRRYRNEQEIIKERTQLNIWS